MKIFIDSLSRRLGDTLLGLPFVSMFKYKFHGAHVTFGCNPNDADIFRNISPIDAIAAQTIYNKPARDYDRSYDIVLRSSFDADAKFKPSDIFGKLDDFYGWKACADKYPINFLYKKEFDFFPNNSKKNVGIFINMPRNDMSQPNGTGQYPIELWQETINLLNDYNVFVFTSLFENIPELDNCVFVGNLSGCDEIALMSQMDVTIGVSCGLMDMLGAFTQKPLIILDSCDDDSERGIWNGIPDKCVLPPNRYATFIMDDEDCRSFIKPPKGSKIIPRSFHSFFTGDIIDGNIRCIDGIKPITIANEVVRILINKKGIEWFIKGNVCDNCDLKDIGKCAYEYKPKIKSGGYYEGRYR